MEEEVEGPKGTGIVGGGGEAHQSENEARSE